MHFFKYIHYLFIVVMLGCTLVFAQKQKPPEGGQPKDFTLPAKETYQLDNGLTVTLVKYGTLPKVQASFVIRAGNINEAENETWLADLTADYLKEGTAERTAKEIAEAAAAMGGEINTSAGMDQTTVSGTALGEFAPDLIALLSDVLMNPTFPESELERLKNNYLRQLSVQKSDPDALALDRFQRALYPNHPYGRLFPAEEMINSFSIPKIHQFYRDNFGAQRTHLYVVGMFDVAKVKDAIQKEMSGWPRGAEISENIPVPVSGRAVYLVDRPGAAQSTIVMGLPVIDPSQPDYIPLSVTNTLLGGFFSSRITTNIREDKGYTYSPHSTISSRYRDAYWAEDASVSTEVTGPSLKEIFYEINRLQKEPPPAEELKGIQNYMAGVFVLQNSSLGGITNKLAFVDLHGLGDDYLSTYVKKVYAVSPADVTRVMNTYLRDGEMIIVIAGDIAKIKEQVAPYGKIMAN